MSEPASYTTAFIANQERFNKRCQFIAAMVAVSSIFVEASNTADHQARVTFGVRVMNQQVSAKALAWAVLIDPNIQAAAIADVANSGDVVADIDIQNRLQNVWTALAVAGV